MAKIVLFGAGQRATLLGRRVGAGPRTLLFALLLLSSGCAVAPLRSGRPTAPLPQAGESQPSSPSDPNLSAPPAALSAVPTPPAPVWERLTPEVARLRAASSEPRPPADKRANVVQGDPSEVAGSEAEVAPAPAGAAPPPPNDPFCVVVPDRPEVRDIIAEFTGQQRSTFMEAVRRSGRYLPMIRSVLAEEALPQELAYLSFVESHFLPDARSISGAVGLWQFMEATARDYGLRVDGWVDERLDPETATRAAIRHLGDLFARFGDWNLAVAAYNAGSGGVGRAVERHGAESFWDLSGIGGLRDQTCRYVVKFLGTVAIMDDPKAFGLAPGDLDPPLVYDTVWAEFPVRLRTVARLASTSEAEIRSLNPALLRGMTPPSGAYPVRVPLGQGTTVARQLRELPEKERVILLSRRAKRGDTLAKLAKHYGTTREAILSLNGGAVKRIRSGQELWIPVSPAAGEIAEARSSRRLARATSDKHVHVVQKGETLWGISRRYGVAPADLIRWNGRASTSGLRAGDRLLVHADKGERDG